MSTSSLKNIWKPPVSFFAQDIHQIKDLYKYNVNIMDIFKIQLGKFKVGSFYSEHFLHFAMIHYIRK